MPSLFISYTSYDRLWAERLYNDLRRYYPTVDIFWDRASIPAGTDYRDILNAAAKDTHHFVVLWSEKAKASNEVGPEIQRFDQSRTGDSKRILFYLPLEGEYGPLSATQAFPDLRDQHHAYDPGANDRGVSKLATEPARTSWIRIIQTIGDKIKETVQAQPVKLAILALNNENQTTVDKLDDNLDDKFGPEPTLREFLDGIKVSLADAKQRYGPTAYKWRPYGDTRTVIDLMQELRMEANINLKPEQQFEWDPLDLFQAIKTAASQIQLDNIIRGLSSVPSVVIVDPISLYHYAAKDVFGRLSEYAKKEQSLIVLLSPMESPGTDLIFRCLRSKGGTVLENYFQPPIPITQAFGDCGVDIRHNMELERLIRSNLGRYYSRRSTELAKAASNMVPQS